MNADITHPLASKLSQGLDQLELEINADQKRALLAYLDLVVKWNSRFNLSGLTDPDQMLVQHLLDSLTLNPRLEGENFLDVGTGAGLPGIPLAICNPDRHFVLLDSNGKKTRFLFQVQLALNLSNITIEKCRIEHYQCSRRIDMVFCRAFAALDEIVELTSAVMGQNTRLLAMKGQYPEAELRQLPAGFEVVAVDQLQIPGSDSERHVVEIRARESA